MSIENAELKIATVKDAEKAIKALRKVDSCKMLDHALEMPGQIVSAIESSEGFNAGDIPLDRSRVHLVGLGGSAVAGELLQDMLAPRRMVSLHYGTLPLRDRRGVIVSSYSGDTDEVVELSRQVTGGLRTVVFVTSGGMLARVGDELALPIWAIPGGYQPRAAVGWSLAYLVCIMERWRVFHGVKERLLKAAKRLAASLEQGKLSEHLIVRAALPIAEALRGRYGVIFHSLRCAGASSRLTSQINENSKQPAFSLQVPEAIHNTVEGIFGGEAQHWSLVFMSDTNDPPSLREALMRALKYFTDHGFRCMPYPAAGEGQFELTLSRLLLADFVSLFLAASKGLDPTPLTAITELKSGVK